MSPHGRASRVPLGLALAVVLFGALQVFGASAASAHPLGNFTVNRYAGLDLSPGTVRLTYVLDLAEIPTFEATTAIDTNGDGTESDAEKQAWADRTAPQVLSNLVLEVNGLPLAMSVVSDSMTFRAGQAGLPILYFRALFEGAIPAAGSVTLTDHNDSDRIGWKEVTVHSEEGVAIAGSSVPAASISDELRSYPVDLLSSPLDVRGATFSFHPGHATAGSGTGGGGPRVGGAPISSGRSFASLIQWKLTPTVLIVSLALAFLFGAVHALGPGHGKTITAAYLVGAGAKRRQAVTIGAAVSIMHTGSVLGLGLVAYVLLKTFPPDRVYPWLTLVTGLVALGLGAGLLVTRIRARRRGLDAWHDHTHPWEQAAGAHDHATGSSIEHDHGHPAGHRHGSAGPASGRGLLALAVAGGILPSPTAFVVLTGAIRYHRLGYGLGLIAAFSAGLAAALMGVGTVALRAQSLLDRRLGSRLATLIPIQSAGVIVGFGTFFAARGLGAGFDPALGLALVSGTTAAVAGILASSRRRGLA